MSPAGSLASNCGGSGDGASAVRRRPVKIKPQDPDLSFQGSNVKSFLQSFELAAELDGANEADMMLQIIFFVKGEHLRREIEYMKGYETKDWEQLKAEMLDYWGHLEPEDQYSISDLEELVQEKEELGGIDSMADYRPFWRNFDKILKDLVENEEFRSENDGAALYFRAFTSDVRIQVQRELMKKNLVPKTKIGRYKMASLKDLQAEVEAELLLRSQMMFSIAGPKKKSEPSSPKSRSRQSDSKKEVSDKASAVEKMEVLMKKMETWSQMFTDSSKDGPEPSQSAPAGGSSLAQPSQSIRHSSRPLCLCFYCSKEGHLSTKCSLLQKDICDGLVQRVGKGYILPNGAPIKWQQGTPIWHYVATYSPNVKPAVEQKVATVSEVSPRNFCLRTAEEESAHCACFAPRDPLEDTSKTYLAMVEEKVARILWSISDLVVDEPLKQECVDEENVSENLDSVEDLGDSVSSENFSNNAFVEEVQDSVSIQGSLDEAHVEDPSESVLVNCSVEAVGLASIEDCVDVDSVREDVDSISGDEAFGPVEVEGTVAFDNPVSADAVSEDEFFDCGSGFEDEDLGKSCDESGSEEDFSDCSTIVAEAPLEESVSSWLEKDSWGCEEKKDDDEDEGGHFGKVSSREVTEAEPLRLPWDPGIGSHANLFCVFDLVKRVFTVVCFCFWLLHELKLQSEMLLHELKLQSEMLLHELKLHFDYEILLHEFKLQLKIWFGIGLLHELKLCFNFGSVYGWTVAFVLGILVMVVFWFLRQEVKLPEDEELQQEFKLHDEERTDEVQEDARRRKRVRLRWDPGIGSQGNFCFRYIGDLRKEVKLGKEGSVLRNEAKLRVEEDQDLELRQEDKLSEEEEEDDVEDDVGEDMEESEEED